MHGSVHSLDEAAAVGVFDESFDESFGDLACASLSSDSSSLGGRLLSVTFPRLLVIYIVVSQAEHSLLISTHPSANATNEAEGVSSDELLGCTRSTRGSRRAKSLGTQSLSCACTVKSGRALGTADGPELLQLAAKFLASGGPVVCNVLSQILDVALEVQLVLLEPADVEFLAGCTTLELSGNVLLVVANDSTGVRIIVERKVKYRLTL